MMHLTPDIERVIVAAIRAGGFPHVAAEAAGVPRRVFRRWLAMGRKPSAVPYGQFRRNVMQARAHARLTAECEVRDKDPKTWLQAGPAKEAAEAPGWGKSAVKPAATDPAELWKLFGQLTTALTPYPEARQAATSVIETAGKQARSLRIYTDDFLQ